MLVLARNLLQNVLIGFKSRFPVYTVVYDVFEYISYVQLFAMALLVV